MTDLIARARIFAETAHAGQLRKYTGESYVEHLLNVADIVAGVCDVPEMIASALLHDTVEDTPVTLDELRAEFGPVVADLVDQLTDVSGPCDGNRAERKAIDRAHLAEASPEAQTIKLADLIDNTRDIVEHDPKFARTYLPEKEALLAVLTRGDEILQARARTAVTAGRAKLITLQTP